MLTTMIVRLSVPYDNVHRRSDGTIDLELEVLPLTPEHSKVLNELFPDLESAVGQLLAKQALLNTMH